MRQAGTHATMRPIRVRLVLVALTAGMAAFGVPAAASAASHHGQPTGAVDRGCRPAKACPGTNPPPDYCDNGGLTGAPIADQINDQYGQGKQLQGIVHDPGVGGFGPLSGPIYTTTRGTPAAAVGTEAACAANAINPIGPLPAL